MDALAQVAQQGAEDFTLIHRRENLLCHSSVYHYRFHTIKAVLPGMKRRNGGRIVNIASAHGLVASPFKSAYVAAKHGLIGLTRSVALEVAETEITCNAICPGYVRTPLVGIIYLTPGVSGRILGHYGRPAQC